MLARPRGPRAARADLGVARRVPRLLLTSDLTARVLTSEVTGPWLGRYGGWEGGEGAALRIVAAQAAPPPPDGVAAIEVAAHEDWEAGAGAAAALLAELQDHTIQGYGVVPGDDAPLLMAEDGLELSRGDGHEGRCGSVGGRPKVWL